MIIIFEQVFILFIFGLIGYILSKTKLASPEHSKILSCLEVYVFLPSLIFKTFSTNFTVQYIKEKYFFLIVFTVILALIVIFSKFLSRFFTKDHYDRDVYAYSLIVTNAAYIGYPLADALFGSQTLLSTMIYSLPLYMFIFTIGYSMLTEIKLSPKNLCNPIIISIVLGCIFGISGLKLPTTLSTILTKSSDCIGPISMLLTGIAVSEFKFKELIIDKKSYIITLFRLIIIPLIIVMLLKPFGNKEAILAALFIYAMPCGSNTIVFPKLIGKECKIGASLALISTVLACITIPLCIYFLA